MSSQAACMRFETGECGEWKRGGGGALTLEEVGGGSQEQSSA